MQRTALLAIALVLWGGVAHAQDLPPLSNIPPVVYEPTAIGIYALVVTLLFGAVTVAGYFFKLAWSSSVDTKTQLQEALRLERESSTRKDATITALRHEISMLHLRGSGYHPPVTGAHMAIPPDLKDPES